MKGTLQCGIIVVLVTSDLSCRCWTVVTGRFIFCVHIPLVICVCWGRFFAFLVVLCCLVVPRHVGGC